MKPERYQAALLVAGTSEVPCLLQVGAARPSPPFTWMPFCLSVFFRSLLVEGVRILEQWKRFRRKEARP